MTNKMSSERKTAIIVGVLYIIGTIAGILSNIVSWGFLETPDYLNTIASNVSRAQLTAFLILVMGFSLAMMPAVMFPILRRKNEVLAVGYVIFRGALETFAYIAGALCWLFLVVVARQYADSGPVAATQFASQGILLGSYWSHIVFCFWPIDDARTYHVDDKWRFTTPHIFAGNVFGIMADRERIRSIGNRLSVRYKRGKMTKPK